MSIFPGLPIPTDPDGVDHPASPLSVVILRDLSAKRFHTLNKWWALTPQSWACPACKRDKRRIAYLVAGDVYAALQDHHDHAANIGATAAFARVIVCTACNFADGNAKRIVEANLPATDREKFRKGFSFCPDDICKFVISASNAAGHYLDRSAVLAAWRLREADFRWRIDHPSIELPAGLCPPPVLSRLRTSELQRAANTTLSSVVWSKTGAALSSEVWGSRAIAPPNARRSVRVRRMPTEEEIDRAVAAKPQHIVDHWLCPCCDRPLRDTVIHNGSKPPFLLIPKFTMARTVGSKSIDICHSCWLLLDHIGRQAGRVAGLGKSFFSLDDIRKFTTTKRNVHHPDVDPDKRDALILQVAARRWSDNPWHSAMPN